MKGLLSIGITDIVGTAISAIFWFFLATFIEPDEFGEIFYFIGIAGIAAYISLIGTQNTIIVYVAKKIKIQSTLYLLSLIVGGISSIIIIMIFYRVDVSLILLGYIINTLALGDLLGKKLYNSYSKYFLIQKILTLVLGFGFYFLFDVQGIIFALALSYIVYSIRVYKVFKKSKIDFSLIKPRLSFIVNNYIMVLAEGTKTPIDKIIIAPLLGFALLGNYSLAMQVIGVMLMFSSIIYKYTLSHDASNNPNKKLKKISILISIGISILGYTLSPIIIPEFFPKYTDAVIAVQIMSFSMLPTMINVIYISKFLGAEKSKTVLFAKLISLITIVTGTVILGSILGMTGLALAYLISVIIETCILALMNFKIEKREKL
jgi:O-antigen/teichoic acid export membrane protein